jgi:hypothetical protein
MCPKNMRIQLQRVVGRNTVASDSRQYNAKVIRKPAWSEHQNPVNRAVSQNPGRVLLAGQSARMQLSLHSSSDALMVSSQVLIPSSQGYMCIPWRTNRIQLTAVEIDSGPFSRSITWIKQGWYRSDQQFTAIDAWASNSPALKSLSSKQFRIFKWNNN